MWLAVAGEQCHKKTEPSVLNNDFVVAIIPDYQVVSLVLLHARNTFISKWVKEVTRKYVNYQTVDTYHITLKHGWLVHKCLASFSDWE